MAMNNELLAIVTYIERERGVSRETVLVAIEQAIQKAAEKNPSVTHDFRVAIDRKTLRIQVFDTVVVSDEDTGTGFISLARARRMNPEIQPGETIEIELPAAILGRVTAQTSRQMIMQKIREAERSNVLVEYKDRVGEIVSGTVTSVVRRDVYVQVGKTEMLMPGKERIPTEEYQVGDSIRAIVVKVDAEANGPAVTISRSSPKFVEALFRLEVSEIADGIVEIMGCSRDPGYRSKLAVRTHDDKVDPVGACVGLRGVRVRDIVRELNGEKIDIVRWNEDIRRYVEQALAPARLESVEVAADQDRTVNVVVPADQYSLCIGKRGQNVRLTTRLLDGWKVNVEKSMAKASFEDQMAEAIRNLADTFDVSEETATSIANGGFLSVDGILATDEESFAAATGLDTITAKGVYAAAKAVAEVTAAESSEEE